MPSPHFVRRTLAAAAACAVCTALAAGSANSQRIVFEPIEWGTPADSVRPRMEAAGWRFMHSNTHGDVWMTNGEAAFVAVAGPNGVVEVHVERRADGSDPGPRHRALSDSLRRVLGRPSLERQDGRIEWERGFTALLMSSVAGSGDEPGRVELRYLGPGADEEEARRRGIVAPADPFPALAGGWAVLRLAPDHRIAVDTATLAEQRRGVYRARIRVDFGTVQQDPSGNHDALIYGSDVDCEGRRVQLRSRTALRQSRTVRTDSGATVWIAARPNSRESFQLEVVCGYVADRAARAP